MQPKVTYHRAKTSQELKSILKLQEQNLRDVLSLEQKQKEGFLTLKHDFNILKKMNDACAHCIAKQDDKVVGYALSMLKAFKDDIPLIKPMLKAVDALYQEQNKNANYIIMGQVCIHKSQRGKGVFRGLYNYMAQELKQDFDVIITEADAKNQRSLNAHKAVGFQVIKTHIANNRLWEIICLEI